MGGSSNTNTVTKQDNTPWGPAQPSLQNIYAGADAAYAATPKTAYSGLYIAPQSQSTILAQQLGSQLATRNMGLGDPILTQSKSLYDDWASQLKTAGATAAAPGGNANEFTDYVNTFINGTDNGKLSAAITAAQQPILQNLQEKIIPQAKLNAVGSGVYGGDASTIAMHQAINDNYTTAATNAASQLAYEDYANKLGLGSTAANAYFDRALQGASLLPALSGAAGKLLTDQAAGLQAGYQINALPIDTLTQIGQAQDSYAQDVVKALYQQWMDQIEAPWNGMDKYRGAIAGYPVSSSGTSTGTTSGGGLF